MTRTKARMCTGKVQHPDKQAADDVMWALVHRGASRSRLNTYRCDHCGFYHVGHVGRRGGVS